MASQKGPSRQEIIDMTAGVMDGELMGKAWPDWNYKHHAYHSPERRYEILQEVGDGVVKRMSLDGLAGQIAKYTRSHKIKAFRMDMKLATETAKYWVAVTKNTLDKMPPGMREKDDKGLCFHRLPWVLEYKPDVETPLFDEFISRCTNAQAFEEFLGSLFYSKSYKEQYLWIYGEGQNGKSSLFGILKKMFGPAYGANDTNSAHNNRFWTAGFLGKSIIAFPDCNSPRFPASALCKSLTGGDWVRVEEKNKPAVDVKLDCKLIFSSNFIPEISGSRADQRRIIYVKVKPIVGAGSANYGERLWEEAPAFFARCKHKYITNNKDHNMIQVDHGSNDELLEEFDEEFQNIFDKHLTRGNQVHRCVISDLLKQNGIKDTKKHKQFKEFLKRRYDAKETRSGRSGPRLWEGIQVKSAIYGGYSNKKPLELLGAYDPDGDS